MRLSAIVVSVATILLSCGSPTRAEDLAVVKSDLSAVQSEIQAAQVEDAKYSGGLVKALISSRIATLRQTEAMLQQKLLSLKLGVSVKYTVEGKAFILPASANQMLASVESEVAASQEKISKQAVEVARFSGGLAQAMAVATLETLRQTHAMLEQKRVSLRYGLPQYIGFAEAYGKAPTSLSVSTGALQPAKATDEKSWSIVAVDTRVTESNSVWWKYAWKLTLRNEADEPHLFAGTIEFQDSDGFIIDTSSARDMVVPPKEERVFTGYALIRSEVASKVARTNAKISRAK